MTKLEIFSGSAIVGLSETHGRIRIYYEGNGRELTGSSRLFETLSSLGVPRRAELSDALADRAISTIRAYFEPGKPARVFRGLGTLIGWSAR